MRNQQEFLLFGGNVHENPLEKERRNVPMEIKTDSKRLRKIMFHLFVWFKISIYYF